MRSRRSALALGLLILHLLPVGRLARADTLVADNFTPAFQFSGYRTDVGYRSPAGTSDNFLNMAPAQRFVPSQGGPLSTITSFMLHWPGTAPDIHVSIRADNVGRPGAILGERSFTAAQFPDSYFPPNSPVSLDLSSLNITLSPAVPYHVVFRTDTAVVSWAYYSLHMMHPHAGSFGFPAYESRDGWPCAGAADR
jgi:hypothetical protein